MSVLQKLRARRGISIILVLMFLAVVALSVVVMIPYIQAYREESAATGCYIGLAEAQRKIDDTGILTGSELDEGEAKYAAVRELKDWTELCPSGGDCYVIPGQNGRQIVVCAYHTNDMKLKTRLNAGHALVETETRRYGTAPESFTVMVNSREQEVTRVEEEAPIKRGTHSTPGYDGTVALYMAKDGTVTYFCYANESYCAIWREKEGWTGDSFN